MNQLILTIMFIAFYVFGMAMGMLVVWRYYKSQRPITTLIDLTETFGAGHEPSLKEMNKMMRGNKSKIMEYANRRMYYYAYTEPFKVKKGVK